MGEPERPEKLINHYLTLQKTTRNIASGLGTLALLWSTVVLLGGFVSVLPIKEFWVLTGLSILMACRVMDNYNEFRSGTYVEEGKIIILIARLRWFRLNACAAWRHTILLGVALLPKSIMFMCVSGLALLVAPYLSLTVSVWCLARRDYGDAGGDAANRAKLAAALDIFYALVLFQSLFVLYWTILSRMFIFSVSDDVAQVTEQQFGDENMSTEVLVKMYRIETRRKFDKEGKLPNNWNFITYAVGLLQSTSGDDHLWGARVLDKLLDNKDIIYVKRELLSSRVAIQNLICMIGRRRGASATDDDIENRERAARILAHLAGDLHITYFLGTLQCICSLLESCNQFCGTCPLPEKNLDEQSRSLEISNHQHDAHMLVRIEDQTENEQEQLDGSSSARLAQRKQTPFLQRLKKDREHHQQHDKDIKEWRGYTYRSRGVKELISQGLVILERLTQDEENCKEIRKHQRLLSKITSPLSSPDFLNNVQEEDTMVVPMLSKSITVLSRLLTSPGDGATRLRQELASTTEAVSNLMAILETDSKGAQQLRQQALEILTELAFDDSFKQLNFNKLFKVLLCIFLEEAPSNNTVVQVEQADRENATRLIREKAGEALARLLPVSTARKRHVNVADIISKQEAINLLTKVLNQILSSKMGTGADAATGAGASNSRAAESVAKNQPPEELDSVQPHTQRDEKQSEERKFMAAMLSLAVVICNEIVISRADFARSTPEDAALAKKLKLILKVNKQCMAECLGVVKLTCQVVIAMIRAKPSCIQHFNEHNFKEALTGALEKLSEVDSCMLFAGNDHEVVKPARSLASLVKEAQQLLN